jgi:hypothetical protein
MSKRLKRDFPKSTGSAFHKDGDVEIVKATSEHAAYLQHRLRPTDIRECMIAGASPWAALHTPLRDKESKTWTILFNGEPACMYGVSGISQDEDLNSAVIWLLGSNLVEKESRKFLRVTRQIVEYLQDRYDLLENVVPIDHNRTIKWLDWLGFYFSDQSTVINGFPCVRFVRCDPTIEVRFE